MWLSAPATVTLPLPFFGIDVYIQPAWWICQSCVTPAVSEIVHLLPCKIALNWGNPSVETWYSSLIKFTAWEREQSARHLHMDTGPRGLQWTSLINILIYHQACWYCHTLKIALSDPLTMRMVIGCGDALLLTGVKRLAYWIVTYFIVAMLTHFWSEERLSGLQCATTFRGTFWEIC